MKEDDEEKNVKKIGKNSKIIVLAVLTAFILCGIYYDTFIGKGVMKNFIQTQFSEKDKSNNKNKNKEQRQIIELQADSRASFRTNGKDFLQASKDGVKYFTGYNNQKWSDTFTMTAPIVVVDGDMTAVAELMGRVVKVYNKDGLMYTAQTENPIIQLSLNESGYLAVIVNNKTDYSVEAYDAKGSIKLRREDADEGVYPVTLDISDDNRVLAVSYADTRDISLISRVLFFYINENESKEAEDSMFASIEKKGEIIAALSFMKNGNMAAVGDCNIFLSDLQGKELWNFPLTNKLDKVSLSGKGSIVIANGDMLGGKDGKEKGTVEWIGLDGRVIGSFQAKANVTYLKAFKDIAIVGAGRDFFAVGENGKEIWHHKASQDVVDILLMENNTTVLYVTQTSAEILGIMNLKEDDKDVEPIINKGSEKEDENVQNKSNDTENSEGNDIQNNEKPAESKEGEKAETEQ